MFDDEETIGGLAAAEQGDEAALDYENPADVARLIKAQAQNRKMYLDDLAAQLKAKRYGPTASERLFALSAAFAAPTSTRGFGGVMSNVMPVFQQFEKAKRDAEEARAADMQKLAMGRMGATDEEIKSALALQKLKATYANAGKPKMTYSEGEWHIQPGTGGVPPLNAKGQYVVSSQEEAASVPTGKKFVFAGDPSGKVYYGQ